MPDLDESNLLVLRDEWEALLDASDQQKQKAWEIAFSRINDEYDSLKNQNKWLSGPTDLLSVIHCSRNEMVHSKLIAWLLDPSQKHSLGSRFLECLLERCFPKETFSNLPASYSQCEVACDAGRADIVVRGVDFTIVIENKVDSVELSGQCDHYFEAFQEHPGPRFVFLTPDRRFPLTATGLAKDAFRCWGYRELRHDLARVLDATSQSPSPAGRAAAQEYLITLTKEFP